MFSEDSTTNQSYTKSLRLSWATDRQDTEAISSNKYLSVNTSDLERRDSDVSGLYTFRQKQIRLFGSTQVLDPKNVYTYI